MLGSGDENKGSGHYGAIITPSFAFGLDTACKNCLWHIEGDRMMWSVGSQMALYNTQSHEMKFVPLGDRGARALVLAVASNHKYFAVAERLPMVEHDQISVYAFGQDKRVKVLPHDPGLTKAESGRVEALHFSENSKYLLAQYGTPDWTLVIWRWYNGKVLASHRTEFRPVLCARFSPVDDLLLAVLTPTCLLQFRLDLDRETLDLLAAPQTWDPFRLTAMSWIAGNMLALAGAAGEVHVVQESMTRLTTRVEALPRLADEVEAAVAAVAAGRSGGGGSSDTAAPAAAASPPEHLTAVAARGRGFVAAGISGTVYFFEPPSVEQKRAGTRDLYVLVRRLALNLPPPPHLEGAGPGHHFFHRGPRPGGAGAGGGGGGGFAAALPPLPPNLDPAHFTSRPVVLLSVSGADEEVAAVTAYGDVAVASMQVVLEREEKPIADVVGPELLEDEPFTRLLGGFMTGRVVGLAAAAAQPLIAAVSSDDRQLRVWHYEARRCVAALTLEDEPLGLDMHPGGQMVLLALTDRIKLYSVMLDALELQFEVAMKRPTAVRFSTGGALFAYVGRTNAVHLHTTYHGQPQLAALKAHASAVFDLRFTVDDRMLVSVGAAGAVYFWDLASYSRVMDLELVDKQALYCSVAVYTAESGAAVVRASDGRMQQIYNGKVHYEVNCRGGQTAPSCLLGADKVLLAADEYGTVMSYAWPSEVPPRPGFASVAPPPHPYPLHSAVGGGISRMVLVPSRGLLFTAGYDGTVLMSSIALVLDGVLLEASPMGLGMNPRARLTSVSSRLTAAASQRLLPAGALGASSMSAGGAGGAAGSSASPGSTSASASSPYYITITEDRLLALREKAIEVAMLVGNAKSDAEYQAFRAGQVLRETISRLEGELEAARGTLAERETTVEKLQETGRLHERRVVKELEGAHMSAAEELETLYEKRLQVEMERVKVMAAARDDLRYKGEEELRRLKMNHEKEMQDLRAAYEAQLAAMEARLGEAGEARAEQDRFFSEYVKQAEVDYEDHSERINKKLHKLTDAAELREQRLKADNNILKRTNLRLKADKTIDMKRMDKLTTDNASLREQAEDLKLTIAKLTKELEERDAVNADNYVTIQQLRRKVQELEKHKYVLSYKAETYSSKLEPQKEEIARLEEALEGHGRELVTQANRAQILTRHVAEKETALKMAKTSLAAFKRRCELQDAAITAFAQELYGAMQLPDDRTVHGKSARQKALDDLVRKYCLGDPRVSANRNAASEAIAAAAAAETRVVLLQWRLDQDARTQRITNRISLNQNSQLLRELQVAQQDNRVLRDRIDAAVVALRELQHRHAMLERRVGLRSGRPGATTTGGGGGGAASGGEEDYLADGGDGEEYELEGGGGGGGGGSSVISLAGRVPPSRPVSGAGPTAAAPTLPASPTSSGRRTPVSLGGANGANRQAHHHARPGTARPPSAGWGLTRTTARGKTYGSVGGAGSGGGAAGGGAIGVAKGAPLKAFAELLVTERQRMESLAQQLETGAAAVGEQQRALLGLRDQLAAAAAAAAEGGDDGDAADGGDADGLDDADLGDMANDFGEEAQGGGIPGFNRFSAVMEGAEEDGEGDPRGGGAAAAGTAASGSTRATAGSSLGEVAEEAARTIGGGGGSGSSSRRVTKDSSGGAGSAGGSPSSYHAPGLRGLNFGGGGGGGGAGTTNRFQGSSGRPLTASLDSTSRRSTASPSALTAAAGRARPGSSSAAPGSYAAVRASASSASPSPPPPPLSGTGPSPIPGAGPGLGGAGPGSGLGLRSGSPPNGRRRPSSAGGVGLRAFTDDKVDRFRPPVATSQKDLPF